MDLNPDAKNSLVVMAVKLLLAREFTYWTERPDYFATNLLYRALEDDTFGEVAAGILVTLLDTDVLSGLGAQPDDSYEQQIRSKAKPWVPAPWFKTLLSQFEPWTRGEAVSQGNQGPPAPVVASEAQARMSTSDDAQSRG